jgi:hypothetical protein
VAEALDDDAIFGAEDEEEEDGAFVMYVLRKKTPAFADV